jgi:hypothetical protein
MAVAVGMAKPGPAKRLPKTAKVIQFRDFHQKPSKPPKPGTPATLIIRPVVRIERQPQSA